MIIDNSKIGNSYDDNGKLLSKDPSFENEPQNFLKIEKNYYTYDKEGNMLTRKVETVSWDGFSRTTNYRFSYTFDKHRNPLTQTEEMQSDNKTWQESRKFFFTYDTLGNLLTKTEYRGSEGSKDKEMKTTYLYDKSGYRWINSEKGMSNFSEGYPDIDFTYDDNGNRITKKERVISWDNTVTESNYNYTYTFDSTGRKLTELCQMTRGGVTTNSYKRSFNYDDKGREETRNISVWYNQGAPSVSKKMFIYDNAGHTITVLTQSKDGNTWVNSGKKVYTYDDAGNTLSYDAFIFIDNAWFTEIHGNTSFTYNNGKSLEVFHQTEVASSLTMTYQFIPGAKLSNKPGSRLFALHLYRDNLEF
jgi:hypothetical protein